MRGRGNGRNKIYNPRGQTFESNGPEVKVRGNAQQVVERYLALARDASSAGDRVAAENYLQHAEHYYRTMNAYAQGEREQHPRTPQMMNDSMQPMMEREGGAMPSRHDPHPPTNGGYDGQARNEQSGRSGGQTDPDETEDSPIQH
jgi:hypothetical protein